MKRVLFVFGTRPEAIKLAPLILKLREHDSFESKICVSGQQKEMPEQVIRIFNIKPDYDLRIMKENQSLFYITSETLRRLESVLLKEKPDLVIVQGDTTTTFVASLSAYYQKIKVAHVEAGLRTEDKFNPFPEEINRRLTDCIADFYFAPTERSKENLLKEGVGEDRIFVTGNTVIDALFAILDKQKKPEVKRKMEEGFLKRYGINFERITILVTGHRRESFGRDFEEICYGLKMIAENSDAQIVYPVHLNPNVQKPVKNILMDIKNVYLIEPLDYYTFVWLMNRAYLILTDSGGIQEEAPSLGKPVLVMRKKTERPEGIEAGSAKLIGTDRKSIFYNTLELLENQKAYKVMAEAKNPYGDGKASERILDILEREMGD